MRAKSKIHLVDIQRKVESQDQESGSITVAWVDFYTDVEASIEPLSVRGYLQSKADQSDVSVRIEIDWRPDIDPTMRLKATCGCHAGKIYNPVGVLEDPNTGQEYITLPCSQGVNQG